MAQRERVTEFQQTFLLLCFSFQILAVYDNTSDDLLKLFENFCDQFRNTKLNSECQFTCSPSNNIYAR